MKSPGEFPGSSGVGTLSRPSGALREEPIANAANNSTSVPPATPQKAKNVTTTHLSRDERMSSILQAATEVVMEKGIEAATITAIANRSGVSRQWLYDFFPDVDSILAALFDEFQREYFVNAVHAEPRTNGFTEFVKAESQIFLDMPVAYAIVTSYALNGGSGRGASGSTLRTMILSSYEATWVTPLVAAGFSREEVFGSILTITNCAVGLNIAVFEGLTTREIAGHRLNSVIEAIIGDAAGPSDFLPTSS